jgi:hypothetical protein
MDPTAEGVEHGVGRFVAGVGAGEAEGSDGGGDEVGELIFEDGLVEAARLSGGEGVGIDEDVDALEKLFECGKAVISIEIESDRALSSMEPVEEETAVGAGFVVDEGASVPHGVAVGRLDLDDVGTVLGEELGGECGREARAAIDDAEVVKGKGMVARGHA